MNFVHVTGPILKTARADFQLRRVGPGVSERSSWSDSHFRKYRSPWSDLIHEGIERANDSIVVVNGLIVATHSITDILQIMIFHIVGRRCVTEVRGFPIKSTIDAIVWENIVS
jgi:hypothetical protein